MKRDATPWGWIAATAYATTLAFAFFSQWLGVDHAESFVYRYQTMITGIAASAGAWVAWRQVRASRFQWQFGLFRTLQAEARILETLSALLSDYESMGHSKLAASLAHRRSGYFESHIDHAHWQTLASRSPPNVDLQVRRFLDALEGLDNQIKVCEMGAGPLREEENGVLQLLEAHVDEAAQRLRDILAMEDADLVKAVSQSGRG